MGIRSVKLVGTATVGPKGQVVIPAGVREKMGIKPGDSLIALYVEDKKVIGFAPEDRLQTIIDKLGEQVSPIGGVVQSTNTKKEK